MSLWDDWGGNIITAFGAAVVSIGTMLTVFKSQVSGMRYDLDNCKADLSALEQRIIHVERHYARREDVTRSHEQIMENLREIRQSQQQLLYEIAHLWQAQGQGDQSRRAPCAPYPKGPAE